MHILGINAHHGGASAAIVVDGQLVAAVEEERFTRIKHDTSLPINAIRYCPEEANLGAEEIDRMPLPAGDAPRTSQQWAQLLSRTGLLQGSPGRCLDDLGRWSAGTPALWGTGMLEPFGPPRSDGSESLESRHRDIASSMQHRLEEVVLEMLRALHTVTGADALCLAGGVALNCVVNSKIFDETPFRELYVQPAAYDGGTSVGAA